MSAHRRIPNVYYIAAAVAIGFICLWQLLYSGSASHLRGAFSTSSEHPFMGMASTEELRAAIRTLNQPSIPASSRTFTTYGGKELDVKGDILWEKSLGEDLCIIDLDDRPFGEAKENTFEDRKFDWKNIKGRLVGVLNHYEYAATHGYKYYYVRTETPEDRRATWKKPGVIKQILKKHKICIYIDSDAMFNHMDMPFEFMLNHWQVKPGKTSLTMAYDPDMDWNKDKFGKTLLNTGFVIAQNIPRTFEIFNAWDTCPDAGPGKFENCSEYKKSYPLSDQAAFGNLIRYVFDKPDDINTIPCGEANGHPAELEKQGCDGEFIKHVWSGKDTHLLVLAGQAISGALLRGSYESFLGEKKGFFHTEKDVKQWS